MVNNVVNNTAQVRLLWSLSGTPWAVNVLHAIEGATSGVDQGTADTIAAELKINTDMAPWLGDLYSGVQLQAVGVRDLNSAHAPEFIAQVNRGGGAGSQMLPPQVAVCVTLRTAKAGQSYRGRAYLGGLAIAASIGAGTIAPTNSARAAQFITGCKTAIGKVNPGGLGAWKLAVASQKLGVSNEVTQIQVRDNVFDTQRRRAIPGAW